MPAATRSFPSHRAVSPTRLVAACLALVSAFLCSASTGGAYLPTAQGPGQSAGETAETMVLVVPVEDTVTTAVAAIVTRGLREAEAMGVKRVVLEIDSPAGPVVYDRALDTVLSRIEASKVATVSFVRGNAFGSGALVALATRETWMVPRAGIGAASPTELSAARVEAIESNSATARAIDDVRERLRGLVRRRGTVGEDAELLAGAMADARLRLFEVVHIGADGRQKREIMTDEELVVLDRDGREVLLREELSSRPLTLQAEQAAKYGISRGTVSSLQDLLYEEVGARPENIRRLDATWSEGAAGWLEAMQPVLFLLGFLLLIVELKTAGFAIPGALGVLLLGFALFGSYLSGLAEITEFLLFGFGLLFIALEIFVVPGTLIFGGLGLLSVGSALVLAQQSFLIPSDAAQMAIFEGNLINLVLLVLFVVVGAVRYSRQQPNTPFLRGAFLEPRSGMTGHAYPTMGENTGGGGTVVRGGEALIGRSGTAATTLRPAGIVVIDGERYDARSAGEFFDSGDAVSVIEVRGTGLVVGRPAESDGAAGTGTGSESGEVSIGLLVFLVALGVCFVVLEVFFVSLGALSILAAVSFVSSIFLAFTHYGQGVGFLFLGIAAVLGPAAFVIALRVLPSTPFGKALFLASPDRSHTAAQAEEPGIHALVDACGEALSDLRPAGFARLAGKRVDVVTRGEMIPAGQQVRVVRVDGNRVVVRAND